MVGRHQRIGAEVLAYQLPESPRPCAVQQTYFLVIEHGSFVQERDDPLLGFFATHASQVDFRLERKPFPADVFLDIAIGCLGLRACCFLGLRG